MLIDTRSVQRFMQSTGYYSGVIDGDYGPASDKAARALLVGLGAARTTYTPGWSKARARIGVEQAMITSIGVDLGKVDGIVGVRTQIGLERWQDHITFDRPPLASSIVSPPTSVRNVWPRQADLRRFYGEPGANQTMLVSPYPLFLDWEITQQVKRFSIHEKVHDSALRVMNRVLDHYGPKRIHELGLDQFGGCLNVRKMRGGSAWSTHAWGVAIDWDADRNSLRETSRTARMARPDYAVFLDLWEAEGWTSLGRYRNFDWMHVQAATP